MVAILQNRALEDTGPVWLQEFRNAQTRSEQSVAWPTRKTEDWKYTNLKTLEQGNYFATQASMPSNVEALRDLSFIEGLDGFKLVFINGQFCEALSDTQGVNSSQCELLRFEEANAEQAQSILEYLGKVVNAKQHLFASINNQLLSDGVFLKLKKNAVLDKPVQVVHISTATDQASHIAQRLLLVLEENSEAQVIEQFLSEKEAQNSFTHGVTECVLGKNARLKHVRLHNEEEQAIHIGGVHVDLHEGAALNSFHLAEGSTIKRIDITVNFKGQGADAEINGVYIPRNKQHVDYHTCMEHAVPHCTSRETFRGIVADNAKAVFNGRIHIHPGAQKTSAQLSNKNLLTSDKAEVDTKPELEIYADDVQCAHGATVAQLDKTALHYLKTRGIDEKEAQVMLSFGFINELVNEVPIKVLCDYLRPRLAAQFASDPSLMRHIV